MDYEIMMNNNLKIGMEAPDFDGISTAGEISLSNYKGKWVVFFSHPGDFTPVCTTEIIGFAKADTYFKKINTELIGISVDGINSHLAWLYDIYIKTGIIVNFPIIADQNGIISRKYGMISNEVSSTETVRNVFIIDTKGIIRSIFIYPMNIGRYIPEILRTVTALQYADKNNCMTPANWVPGNPMILPPPKNFKDLLERNNSIAKNRNGMSWYLSFKNVDDTPKLDKG